MTREQNVAIAYVAVVYFDACLHFDGQHAWCPTYTLGFSQTTHWITQNLASCGRMCYEFDFASDHTRSGMVELY